MPKIPVNTTDLPTEFTVLEEDTPYETFIKELRLVGAFSQETGEFEPILAKNGDPYMKMTLEVLQPEEFKGKRIFVNYIGINESNVYFGKFMACFKVPCDPDGINFDDEGLAVDAIGCQGIVTTTIDTYEGKKQSRLKDYMLS